MSDAFGNSFAMSRFAGLSVEQVKRDIGDAFLVIQAEQPSATSPTSSRSAVDDPSGLFSKQDGPPPEPTRGLVYAVARKPSSTFAWIAVGRHENNDVWMPHSSISRFHAMLRHENNAWSLQDAKSANGTFVQNTPVTAHGTGEPTPLRSGQEVRFGDIITLFLDAAGIVSLATRTRSRGPIPGIGS